MRERERNERDERNMYGVTEVTTTIIRWHICNNGDTTFVTKTALEKHNDTYHGTTEIIVTSSIPLKCKLCDATFLKKRFLNEDKKARGNSNHNNDHETLQM